MNKKFIFLLSLSLNVALVNAQDKKIGSANNYFDHFEYSKAINQYENLIADGTITPEILRNLGDANYYNANYEEAEKWYTQLANTSSDALDIEHSYRYANTLRSVKKYEASDELLKKTNLLTASSNVDFKEEIIERKGSYTIKNSAINSEQSDFAPSFLLDGIVFSTARDTSIVSKTTHNWNKKSFLNLYSAILSEDGSLEKTDRFSDRLNTKLHESSSVFSKDGNTVYFTRNKEKGNNFGRDQQGISRLKLYKADFTNGAWTNVKALPFNQEGYSMAHPALNKAENKLYFSSDIPGTVGESDIFEVDIKSDGTYSTPRNLGEKINTFGRETFPFITDDDILYFSSDLHRGLGGLDVFAVNLLDLENSNVVNLGEPINSVSDDFSFIIKSDSKKGYFASNRANGKGDDDIYAITEVKPIKTRCFSNLSGLVKNKATGDNLPNANVVLMNEKGEFIEETTSDNKGEFILKSDCAQSNYVLVANKENFESARLPFTKKENENTSNIDLLLSGIDMGAPANTDLATYLNIAPVYFDLNKWNIRPDAEISLQKIISYLEKYPNVKLRIGSHTDSRATKAYNMQLSNKRANSTMEFLIKKGIAASRLSAAGFGETLLVNECSDEIPCAEVLHEQNRRSAFIVEE